MEGGSSGDSKEVKERSIAEAIRYSFKKTETYLQEIMEKANNSKTPQWSTYKSGSTASVAVIDTKNNRVHVGWCGDSRIVLGRRYGNSVQARALMEDHKPENEFEKERIENSGGEVYKKPNDGCFRVYQAGSTA